VDFAIFGAEHVVTKEKKSWYSISYKVASENPSIIRKNLIKRAQEMEIALQRRSLSRKNQKLWLSEKLKPIL